MRISKETHNVLAVIQISGNNEGVSLAFFPPNFRRATLLTESEVSRSWNRLFKSTDLTTDTFDNAENLLDELRPESPLRHRLGNELEELREIHASRVEA